MKKSQNAVELFFDQFAPHYNRVISNNRYQGSKWLNSCLSQITWSAKKSLRIVDLGCGTGKLGRRLRRRFPMATILGVDISGGMIGVAKETCVYDQLFWSDLAAGPVKGLGKHFDLVVGMGVTEYLNSDILFFKYINSILSSGGYCVTSRMVSTGILGPSLPGAPRIKARSSKKETLLVPKNWNLLGQSHNQLIGKSKAPIEYQFLFFQKPHRQIDR